ncbi:hypothetical protein PDN49_24220 [Bacillus cereus]|uniref:Uncharacterized protein n=1 Tax=Bacillus pretiosus TaxID=2983392 RepID=A0ABT3EPY6_9BACI|nr:MULTISPECIES: hypothetical protein [Bacillus cereus group]MCW1238749.1 hypothetical protein [Bacillus pretiosus]MDA2329881.1 hypothetical protein [Bacillus cereus]MDA2335645.1 hypothetical protein [Bacillus cereus]MDA2357863.1 hypothetical protein [Bacillus cereus]MED2792339.1 hypothetical protein [Bacillus wiedmannii]
MKYKSLVKAMDAGDMKTVMLK